MTKDSHSIHSKQTQYIRANTDKCVACWQCLSVCPKQVIGKVSILWHKHIRFVDPKACIGCKKCIQTCPEHVFELSSTKE